MADETQARDCLLAVVEGHAAGAGASLALACDRAVAEADATFVMSFTRVGIAEGSYSNAD